MTPAPDLPRSPPCCFRMWHVQICSVLPQEQDRRKDAEEAAGVERVDVFGRHIKAKHVDGSYRAMEGPEKVNLAAALSTRPSSRILAQVGGSMVWRRQTLMAAGHCPLVPLCWHHLLMS